MIDLAMLLGTFLAGLAAGLFLLLRIADAREGPNLRADRRPGWPPPPAA